MIHLEECVEIRRNKWGQKGLFARRDFAAGERIADHVSYPMEVPVTGWAIMTFEEAKQNLPPEQIDNFIRYGFVIDFDGGIYGPVGECVDDEGNFINHSCEPNVWNAEEGDRWEARRDIKAGPRGLYTVVQILK